jgi:hypothetical protein
LNKKGAEVEIMNSVPALFKKFGETEVATPKEPIKCCMCVAAERAVGWIVFTDIISGLLIIPVIKAVAANNFHSNIVNFKSYIRLRFYSIVLELTVCISALIVIVNIVAWKQLDMTLSLLLVAPFTILSIVFFIFEFHFQNVLKTAYSQYQD